MPSVEGEDLRDAVAGGQAMAPAVSAGGWGPLRGGTGPGSSSETPKRTWPWVLAALGAALVGAAVKLSKPGTKSRRVDISQ